MNKALMIENVKRYCAEQIRLISEGGVSIIEDHDVDAFLDILKERDLWSDKTHATYMSMVKGGKAKSIALSILTDGNHRIKEVMDECLVDEVEEMVKPKQKPKRKRSKAT